MSITTEQHLPMPPSPVLFTLLPGPDRQREECTYCYRLTYRGSEAGPGCVMLWEVLGGRQGYQIAVEREERGSLRLHCTCADAVYRAEEEGRPCKHIRGLLAFVAPVYPISPVALRAVA
jgi:hypothetical protein